VPDGGLGLSCCNLLGSKTEVEVLRCWGFKRDEKEGQGRLTS